MNKIVKIAKRDYFASVRSKGFIIGLILAPILMGGSLIVFAVMKDRVDTTERHVALLDHTGVVAESIIEAADVRNSRELLDPESGKQIRPAYHFQIADLPGLNPSQQRLILSDRVRNGEINAFVEIGPNVLNPSLHPDGNTVLYYANNPAMDDLRGWLNWPVNERLRRLRLDEAGIDAAGIGDLFHWMNTQPMGLVTLDESSGDIKDATRSSELQALLIPIVMMMLMFLMIMLSVPGMLQSVMEEKTQGIAEVLLGSVSPSEFMGGKVLAGIAVSLTSSAVYVLGGLSMIHYMGYLHMIPLQVIPWFLVYMLLAVVMMGSIAAALGATCSEAKDAQNLNLPMMMPMLIPMFVYLPVIKEPQSAFSTVFSLIPVFTPLLMMLRQATPEAIPLWQPWLGLFLVVLTSLFFVWIGGRIFRIAILIKGTPPKFSNIVKWAFKG